MPVIIVLNYESSFEDVPGVTYEYGKRDAIALLQPGTRVIFYTDGRRAEVKNPRVSPLSNKAHYFAFGVVGNVTAPNSASTLFKCDFSEYSPFTRPVMLRDAAGEYLEPVAPLNNVRGYFQNGVRGVGEDVFLSILHLAGASFDPSLQDEVQSPNVELGTEGGRKMVITNRIERDRTVREQALQIHGCTCMACDFNFGSFYGDYGSGYIHVHHLNPLGNATGRRTVNAETDLTVLCANCHCIVHRRRNELLTVSDLKRMIKSAGKR